ncbi:MAG: hypothetical protein NTV36_03125 [Candidatus Staskawiczbacteria bacterium]|nr:hypothetical protein [Candidatus Staskawiczbacteria bacterium]
MSKEKIVESRIYEAVATSAKAIVVRCPDRRFRIAHNLFIGEELGLTGNEFWPIKMAGGAGALARPDEMPHDFACIVGQIATFCSHDPVEHIVLFTHQHCRHYSAIRGKTGGNPERDDLEEAIRFLSEKYPYIETSAYFAAFTDDRQTHIFFETIKECSLREGLLSKC